MSYSYVLRDTGEAFAKAAAYDDLVGYYTEVHTTAQAMWPVVAAAITWAKEGGDEQALRELVDTYEAEYGSDVPFSADPL